MGRFSTISRLNGEYLPKEKCYTQPLNDIANGDGFLTVSRKSVFPPPLQNSVGQTACVRNIVPSALCGCH